MNARRYLTVEEFGKEVRKDENKKNNGEIDAVVCLNINTEIKVVAENDRELEFIISTASVDRYGDVIAQDGWDFKNYLKNPVVLWAHDNRALPVAKAKKLSIDGNNLLATAEFTRAGLSSFNDTVFNMLKDGFLNAVSVGFIPKKWAYVDDDERGFGIDFIQQELLEFSVVPIPANPEALIQGKDFNESSEIMLNWAKNLLNITDDSMIINKNVYKELTDAKNELTKVKIRDKVIEKRGSTARLTSAYADLAALRKTG